MVSKSVEKLLWYNKITGKTFSLGCIIFYEKINEEKNKLNISINKRFHINYLHSFLFLLFARVNCFNIITIDNE